VRETAFDQSINGGAAAMCHWCLSVSVVDILVATCAGAIRIAEHCLLRGIRSSVSRFVMETC
jgi:hypothetical protein